MFIFQADQCCQVVFAFSIGIVQARNRGNEREREGAKEMEGDGLKNGGRGREDGRERGRRVGERRCGEGWKD